jgi:hypothetical protein
MLAAKAEVAIKDVPRAVKLTFFKYVHINYSFIV